MYRLYSGKYTRGILVEMVMAEGEIEFERVEIDILRGEEKKPEYLAINPAGWVPALVCPDGVVLTETPAINLYLGERHRITSLVPALDDPDRALSYLRSVVLNQARGICVAASPAVIAWFASGLRRRFRLPGSRAGPVRPRRCSPWQAAQCC